MDNKKSGKELRKDYQELLNKTKALENRIVKRAKNLTKQYPNVIYNKNNNRKLTVDYYNKTYIITPDIGLTIIESIEQWIADQHPHQQLEINFVNLK
jgi:gas vesicle protein